MKLKLITLLFAAIIGGAVTAQKNKKTNKAQGNAAAANNASETKKTGRIRNLDSIKTQQAASPKKMKKAGKQNAAAPDKLVDGDDPFGKPANGLSVGDDPFGKTPRGKNRKKATEQQGNIISDSLKTQKGKKAKAAGYANQDVNYMQQPAPSPQPSPGSQPVPATEAASGNNSNITAVGQQAAPNNASQAATVDKSPSYIHVRFDMENVEAPKKELTGGLNESENEVGWYKKLRVQSAGIDNLRIFSVTLYKLDGSSIVIPINETIIKGGTSTSLFNTGLKNETKNNVTVLEKINKVSVFYELLDPTAKKKNMCAIQVYLFK